jgi:hypothetical protein
MSEIPPASPVPAPRRLAIRSDNPERLFEPLSGISYRDALHALHRALAVDRYFEIGSRQRDSLARMRREAVAVFVDPAMRLKPDLLADKTELHLYQQTSDAYFARHDPRTVLGGPIQLAFIDGLHHSDAVLRDFANTERFCDPGGAIVLHDCLPWNDAMAQRRGTTPDGAGVKGTGAWAGDVWRVLPVLARRRPGLRITVLDCPPTGLVVITGLDPSDRGLGRQLPAILARLDAGPARPGQLAAWLEGLEVADSRAIAAAGQWQEAIGLAG